MACKIAVAQAEGRPAGRRWLPGGDEWQVWQRQERGRHRVARFLERLFAVPVCLLVHQPVVPLLEDSRCCKAGSSGCAVAGAGGQAGGTRAERRKVLGSVASTSLGHFHGPRRAQGARTRQATWPEATCPGDLATVEH